MTALSLNAVVEGACGCWRRGEFYPRPKGRPRTTTWRGIEHGFSIRHYATGRGVYIVQTRMAGRLRTVTLGSVAALIRYQATMVARRVIAYAQVGRDPATDRQRIQSSPRFDDFLVEYWAKWAPRWKPSTYESHTGYRTLYLDHAFPGIFIDALNEADVTKWFADLNNRTGPGAANRALDILKGMLNKAESWGYRLENTNPCPIIRRNPERKCERFLSDPELARLEGVLANESTSDDEMRRLVVTAITLLSLTGARRGEILGLQWGDVHGNRLKIRDSKTGAKTV